jgi:hypothetical protein
MGDTVTFEVPQDVLDSARLTAPELKLELAILLYSQNRLYDIATVNGLSST